MHVCMKIERNRAPRVRSSEDTALVRWRAIGALRKYKLDFNAIQFVLNKMPTVTDRKILQYNLH